MYSEKGIEGYTRRQLAKKKHEALLQPITANPGVRSTNYNPGGSNTDK
jgi:hypothetical protein